MNWFIPYLVVFMVHPFCVVSEVQLTQPGGVIVKPGQTLSLMCAITLPESEDFDYHVWSWIRQSPGKGLEWMGFITTNQGFQDAGMDRSYAPSLKSRLTFSLDSSMKQLSLQLSSVAAADSATYYCTGETQ